MIIIETLTRKMESFGETWWGMAILIAAPIFIVLSPVLIGGYDFMVDESERFQQGFYFYKEALLNNGSFFWNPYLFSGFPNFVSLTGGFLSPFMYIGLFFFPVSAVYNWLNFLYIVFTGFFTAIFLKKISIGFWGRYLGGIIFILAGWSHGDMSAINGFFLLPLLFLLILIAKESGGWKYFLILLVGSISVAIVWFSSHWHFLIEILFVSAVFSLFLSFVEFFQNKRDDSAGFFILLKLFIKKYIKAPVSLFLMTLGGTIIAFFQLIPTYVFIQLSTRIEQISHTEAIQGGVHFYDIIGFFLPYFNYPFLPLSSYAVNYLCILSVFLFISAINFKFRKNEPCGFVFFFSAFFIFGVLMSFNNSPLFWLIHHLPLIDLLHAARRWMIISSFSIAILSAFGLEIILKNFEEFKICKRTKISLEIFKWSSILLAAAGVSSVIVQFLLKDRILSFANDYFRNNFYKTSLHFPIEHYYAYLEKLFNDFVWSLNPINLKFFLPFLFVFLSYIFIKLYVSGKLNPQKFVLWLFILVLLNFIAVFRGYYNIQPKNILIEEPETVKFLKTQENGRIFSFMRFFALNELGEYKNTKEKSLLKKELLFPNKNIIFGLETIDSEGDPMTNKNMAKLVEYVGGAASTPGGERLENFKISPEEKFSIFLHRKPMLNFLCAKYLLSSYPVDEKVFPKIFETEVTGEKIKVFVYENKEARPLYYFTDENWLMSIDENIPAEELNIKLAESDGGITQNGINLLNKKNELLKLETKTERQKLLVFSQNNLPGWSAYIDNNKTTIYNIGTVYMGVEVPEGKHVITFKYSYWEIWRYFLDNYL